jgi:hypothetical protein
MAAFDASFAAQNLAVAAESSAAYTKTGYFLRKCSLMSVRRSPPLKPLLGGLGQNPVHLRRDRHAFDLTGLDGPAAGQEELARFWIGQF